MRIFPKKFTLSVFGSLVKVEVIDGLHAEGIAGAYNGTLKKIYISIEQQKEDATHTLLHELGHAIIDRTGIRQSLSSELEEVIVENFATGILENFTITLKKNKKR